MGYGLVGLIYTERKMHTLIHVIDAHTNAYNWAIAACVQIKARLKGL